METHGKGSTAESRDRSHWKSHNALLDVTSASKQVVSIMLKDMGWRECLLWGTTAQKHTA